MRKARILFHRSTNCYIWCAYYYTNFLSLLNQLNDEERYSLAYSNDLIEKRDIK